MKIVATCICDLYILIPYCLNDNRGYFYESYNTQNAIDASLTMKFVQDNQSMSKKGVLRGMHFQKEFPQGKLVRCIRGKIWDVVVDLRKESETFGRWFGIELSAENKKQLYIPENFAHGFLALSEESEVCFKVTDHYQPSDEVGFAWNDPEVGIEWPIPAGMNILLAEKDKGLKSLKDVLNSAII
jgi:dTDP-4-dehydrorhamnose 3,5-epimerase